MMGEELCVPGGVRTLNIGTNVVSLLVHTNKYPDPVHAFLRGLQKRCTSTRRESRRALGSAAGGVGVTLPLQVHRVVVDEVIRSVVRRQGAPHRLLEGRRHIGGVLGARLEVRVAAVLAAPLPSVLPRNLPLRHVQLVAQHHEGEAVRLLHVGVIRELLLPVGQVAEALPVVHAEGEQAAVGAAVERRAEAAEALLARRVPDLQGDVAAVHLQLPVEELHADGVEEVRVELVGDVAVHERRLADAAVAQEDDLQEGRL